MEHAPTDQRRAEIVEALLVVMAEHGYAKATIAKIAAAANLNQGLLHYHFKNKQQILLALLDQLAAQEMSALESLEGPASEKLTAVIDRLLATGDSARPEAVAAWVTIAAEAIRQPEVADRMRGVLQWMGRTLTAVIEEGVASGEFEPDRPVDEVVAAFLALVQGYYTLAATARDLVPTSSAAPAARAMMRAMLRAEFA